MKTITFDFNSQGDLHGDLQEEVQLQGEGWQGDQHTQVVQNVKTPKIEFQPIFSFTTK